MTTGRGIALAYITLGVYEYVVGPVSWQSLVIAGAVILLLVDANRAILEYGEAVDRRERIEQEVLEAREAAAEREAESDSGTGDDR